MTQAPLNTHSLFDDLLDQYQAADHASHELTPNTTPAPAVDEVQPSTPTSAPAESTAASDYQTDALAMAEFIEFRGSKMHVTDPQLVTSKIQRFKLSPSTTSSLLDTCPASWAFGKLLPFDDSPFSPAGAGGLAHEALEHFYELPPKQRDGVALAEEISKVVHKTFPHDAAKGALLTQKLNHLAGGIFDLEDPMSIDVDRVEETIDATIAGVPITGTVDRTERVDDGELWIGDYKGLALDTPIPTPTGWTTMGDLQVGDQVLGTLGQPTTVTIKSDIHHRECYRIEFSDGSSVVCDNVHLWQVNDLNAVRGGEEVVVSADELFERFTAAIERGKKHSLIINNPEPIELPARDDLELDPYILGSWLGNGASRGGEIHYGYGDAQEYHDILTGIWGDQVSFIREASGVVMTLKKPQPMYCPIGVDHGEMIKTKSGNVYCAPCASQRGQTALPSEVGTNVSLSKLLRRMNLLHNKHVPMKYLRGSIDQRLALLQGLMDTDGHFNPLRNRCVFVTTTPALADAVAELIASFGITVQQFSGENGHKGFQYVEFRPEGFNPFRLRRKAAGVENMPAANRMVKCRRRYIKSMQPVDSVPTQCIQVDAPNSLYLCGTLLIPTHNTGKFKQPEYRVGYERAMRTYTLLKEAQTGIRPVGASLLYTADKREVDIDISDDLLEETKDDLVDAWELHNTCIEESAFPTVASPLCGWCPLANLCPTAQDAGFGPSEKAIDAGVEFIPDPEADDNHEEDPPDDRDAGAGHYISDTDPGAAAADTPTPQKAPMTTQPLIEELPPYEMLTDNGELNPNSWAANTLFRLYSRIDEAIRTAHPEFDRERQQELTKLTLGEVTEVIMAGVSSWTGVDPTPQDGAFTRLAHIADIHIRTTQCNFDDEDDVTAWLEQLAAELGFATGTVLDLFDEIMPTDD